MMPFGQFNAVVISVSQNCPLTKAITYQLLVIRCFPRLVFFVRFAAKSDTFLHTVQEDNMTNSKILRIIL